MRATIILLAAMLSSQADSADPAAGLKLTHKVQLLGGRLEAALPTAMQLEARSHSILSTESSGQDEPLAVIDSARPAS